MKMKLKVVGELLGDHLHLRLFMGQADDVTLANIGNLTLHVSEWIPMRRALIAGCDEFYESIALEIHDHIQEVRASA